MSEIIQLYPRLDFYGRLWESAKPLMCRAGLPSDDLLCDTHTPMVVHTLMEAIEVILRLARKDGMPREEIEPLRDILAGYEERMTDPAATIEDRRLVLVKLIHEMINAVGPGLAPAVVEKATHGQSPIWRWIVS